MNRPNANPSSSRLQKRNEVLAGLHRLPGASNFVRPSTKTTPIKKTVDVMPRSEPYERRDSGRKTVGIRLEGEREFNTLACEAQKDDEDVQDQTKQLVSI